MNDNFEREYEDDLFGESVANEAENQEEEEVTQNEEQSDDDYQEDYDEFGGGNDDEEEQEDSEEEPEDDYLTRLLKKKNINRNKIQFENEDGEIEEYKFDDLDDEDKYAILAEDEELPITDQEIEDINFLRDRDLNLADFIAQQREQAIREYLEQNSTPHYEVDELNDDQLFVYDLINRYGEEFSNEELDAELQKAHEDEDMFAKKMTFLRNQYKEQEEANKQAAAAQAQQEHDAEKQELINSLTSAAINTTEIQGVELEDTDRNEILDFLLLEDANNRTEFSKLLSDPEALFKMAWFMKYGESTFNTTVDYFKNELAKARRSEDKKPARTVVRQKEKSAPDPYGLDSIFKKK